MVQDKIIDRRMTSAINVYEYYKNIVTPFQEHFYCLYLDSSKKVLEEKLLFIGTVNQSMVHPRDVFKEAYLLSASSIICVHNHPSGDSNPSKEDILLTERIIESGKLLNINVLDHIVVGDGRFISIRQNKLLKW